jgi:hypothetical protein
MRLPFSTGDVAAIAVGIFIGKTCFGFHQVEGQSMEPTFFKGDYLLSVHPLLFRFGFEANQFRKTWLHPPATGLRSLAEGNGWPNSKTSSQDGEKPVPQPDYDYLLKKPVILKVAVGDSLWRNGTDPEVLRKELELEHQRQSQPTGGTPQTEPEPSTGSFCKRVGAIVGQAKPEDYDDGSSDLLNVFTSQTSITTPAPIDIGQDSSQPTEDPSASAAPSPSTDASDDTEEADAVADAEAQSMMREAQRRLFLIQRVPGNTHLWVLGDNWRESHDSRHFGPVHPNRVTGVVVGVVWPLQRLQFFNL